MKIFFFCVIFFLRKSRFWNVNDISGSFKTFCRYTLSPHVWKWFIISTSASITSHYNYLAEWDIFLKTFLIITSFSFKLYICLSDSYVFLKIMLKDPKTFFNLSSIVNFLRIFTKFVSKPINIIVYNYDGIGFSDRQWRNAFEIFFFDSHLPPMLEGQAWASRAATFARSFDRFYAL